MLRSEESSSTSRNKKDFPPTEYICHSKFDDVPGAVGENGVRIRNQRKILGGCVALRFLCFCLKPVKLGKNDEIAQFTHYQGKTSSKLEELSALGLVSSCVWNKKKRRRTRLPPRIGPRPRFVARMEQETERRRTQLTPPRIGPRTRFVVRME